MKKLYIIKLKIKSIYTYISLILISILINISKISTYAMSPTDPGYLPPSSISTREDFMSKFNELLSIRNFGLTAFSAFTILTTMLVFIYHFCILAFVSTNPKERRQALRNLLIAGGCFTLEGCATTIWILLNWFTT